MAGHTLTHINEQLLAKPVKLEGGPDHMRAEAHWKDGAVWASDRGKITTIAQRARDAGKDGKPVNLVYTATSGKAGDCSTMMSDALLAQLPTAKLTQKTIDDFDAVMRTHQPTWPGLLSPRLREERLKSGGMRKAVAETAGLGEWQKLGMPDIASTRYAITEPALVGKPSGSSGHAMSRLDPNGRIIENPQVPHSTYDTQLAGEAYLGGLEHHVPREIMFSDWWARRQQSPQQTPGAQ